MFSSPHTRGSTARQFTVALALSTILAAPPVTEGAYQQHNLVSDLPNTADQTDANLVNAWGIVFHPNGPVWINNNGTGTSTLYDGKGEPFPVGTPLVVHIPVSTTDASPGNPTGIVFNSSTTDFLLTKDTTSAPSAFIFASESGVITAWASTVDAMNALVQVDNSTASSPPIYKGLALAGNGTGHFLYATDFHNGKIDVFDATFKPATLAGNFTDPNLPEGFAPFGIRNINGDVYVTYAKQDADKKDDVPGKGLGLVNVFDANGNLRHRFAADEPLNAPWGLTLAPASFGRFRGRLLVGNFGDGTILAYDLATGQFHGRLKQADGTELTIDGLWGLSFGNGVLDQPTDTLFFTAGPQGEAHGLYGRIERVAKTP